MMIFREDGVDIVINKIMIVFKCKFCGFKDNLFECKFMRVLSLLLLEW